MAKNNASAYCPNSNDPHTKTTYMSPHIGKTLTFICLHKDPHSTQPMNAKIDIIKLKINPPYEMAIANTTIPIKAVIRRVFNILFLLF